MLFNPQLFKVSIIQTKLFGPLDFELSRFHCICNNGHIQIQWWKSPFHKFRVERVNRFHISGLDYCPWRVCSLLLWWTMFVSSWITHECHQPCDHTEPSLTDKALHSAKTMLCSNETLRSPSTLLWWQVQCHFKKIQTNGGQSLWMSLKNSNLACPIQYFFKYHIYSYKIPCLINSTPLLYAEISPQSRNL